MRKLLWLALLSALPLGAQVTPGLTTPQIQTIINNAAVGGTVTFAAGTYSITAQLTLKCGVTYTGPIATPATAILNGSGAGIGSGNGLFTLNSNPNLSNPCTQATTIQYLNFQSTDTSLYVRTSFTNLTVQHNQFTSIPGRTSQTAGIVFESGTTTSNTASMLTNATIIWNQFGDLNSCISPTNVMTNTDSPETYEGACNGMVFFTSIDGLTVNNNSFFHVAEGVHINCPNYGGTQYPCEPPPLGNGARIFNVTARYNDFNQIHRINWEQQPQPTSGEDWQFNSSHDWFKPYFGSFGLSMACCYNGTTPPNMIASNNVVLFNVGAGAQGRYGYGMEAMGKNANYNNELLQAAASSGNAPGMAWGCGNVTSMSNNTVQGNFGGYIVKEGDFPCGTVTTPILNGNVTGPTVTPVTSVAPTISPSPGAQSFPLTVTLTDPGFTSGPQPLGNTGIWYTTDGSTPVPGSGTAKRLDSGGTFTLPSAATVKAVGMWGAVNQPASYPSGFGFTASSVVSSTFTATSVFNCGSGGFTTTNTPCGVGGLIAGSGTAFKVIGTQNGATPSVTGGNVIIANPGVTHFALSMMYQTAVNVAAFTTTFTFIPNGQNMAFMLNNCANNGATGAGTCGGFSLANFSSGASCEGDFYQEYSPNPFPYNVFALMFDQYAPLSGSSFSYSSAQIYQQNQSPCIPNPGGPIVQPYWQTTKFSTSPVPLNSPATSRGTTTGDTYSSTLTYDGSTLTLNLFDVTAGGSCPGASCFTQTWSNVSIPSQVNGTTAYVGIGGSTGTASIGNLEVTSWTYSATAPSASPSSTVTAAGSPTATNPTFSPIAGSYTGTQNITIASAGSSNICYALGAPGLTITPIANQLGGCAVGALYSSPVAISSSQTLYATAGLNGTGTSSGVVQGVYTVGSATLTGGFQGNSTNANTLNIGTPAVQQTAIGTYSDGDNRTLPDGFGNTAVWSSSNGTVLQVTSSGMVSCLTTGTANSQVSAAPSGKIFSPWTWHCNAAMPASSTGVQVIVISENRIQ